MLLRILNRSGRTPALPYPVQASIRYFDQIPESTLILFDWWCWEIYIEWARVLDTISSQRGTADTSRGKLNSQGIDCDLWLEPEVTGLRAYPGMAVLKTGNPIPPDIHRISVGNDVRIHRSVKDNPDMSITRCLPPTAGLKLRKQLEEYPKREHSPARLPV